MIAPENAMKALAEFALNGAAGEILGAYECIAVVAGRVAETLPPGEGRREIEALQEKAMEAGAAVSASDELQMEFLAMLERPDEPGASGASDKDGKDGGDGE